VAQVIEYLPSHARPWLQPPGQPKTCRATTKAVEVGGLQFEANLGKGYWDPVSKTSWKPGAGDLLCNSTEAEIRRGWD
jgi:hypothetical protein